MQSHLALKLQDLLWLLYKTLSNPFKPYLESQPALQMASTLTSLRGQPTTEPFNVKFSLNGIPVYAFKYLYPKFQALKRPIAVLKNLHSFAVKFYADNGSIFSADHKIDVDHTLVNAVRVTFFRGKIFEPF